MNQQEQVIMKVGFIGGGNMAAAMIGGMLQKGFSAADIVVDGNQCGAARLAPTRILGSPLTHDPAT
jgi:pyrroline-5-carboxylate reductase